MLIGYLSEQIAGEIPRNKQNILRRESLAAACVVGSLYLIVVAVSIS